MKWEKVAKYESSLLLKERVQFPSRERVWSDTFSQFYSDLAFVLNAANNFVDLDEFSFLSLSSAIQFSPT